jgi:hypothetical protein
MQTWGNHAFAERSGVCREPSFGHSAKKGFAESRQENSRQTKNLDKIWVFRELFLAVDKIGFGESFFLANSYFADRFHLAYGKIYLSILYIYLLYPRQKHL